MPQKSPKFKWNGYVSVNIPSDLLGDAEKYITDNATFVESMNQALIDNYKLGVRHNPDDGSYIATLTCFDGDSDNFGYAMSAFGSDWYTACAVVLFKHFEVTGENWTDYRSSKSHSFG